MSKRSEERIWERAAAGEHTAVLGFQSLQPPASLRVVRVSCDVPQSTLGPIADAHRKVAVELGDSVALLEQARDMLFTGLRRRFLGDMSQSTGSVTAALVEACHRLARGEHKYALLFDAVDAADPATLESLRRLVQRPGVLALPLILVFRAQVPSDAATLLLAAVRRLYGDDAVVVHEAAAAVDTPADFDWLELPVEVRQVLRAGALIGSGFEADLVAALLELSSLDVLDCLQQAADAGVPIEDRGEERFFLPESVITALVSSMLPSLKAVWHRRLGWLLASATDEDYEDFEDSEDYGGLRDDYEAGDDDDYEAGDDDDDNDDPSVVVDYYYAGRDAADASARPDWTNVDVTDDLMDYVASVGAGGDVAGGNVADDAAGYAADADDAAVTHDFDRDMSGPRFAEVFAAAAQTDTDVDMAGGLEDLAQSGDVTAQSARVLAPEVRTTQPQIPTQMPTQMPMRNDNQRAREDWSELKPRYRDQARAASHLSAAGQIEDAARKYAGAAGEASSIGAYEQAMAHGRQALELIESLSNTPERRRFRAQMLVALGRLQWQAAGMLDGNPDPAFTLENALETADVALTSLRDNDPADLISEAHELIAGICYDIGSTDALERALDELTRAARLFLADNRAGDAARLLNDQAAIYVRLGDPVRATHLLTESQKIFEQRAEDDPMAIQELAETHHLLARLPLHATIREGRERDAYTMALEHANLAEEKYQRLGDVRETARVWETKGRIELMNGHLDEAAQRLSSALQVQSQTGDLTGLARSTAALSDVLAAGGRFADALAVLGDSITLNREKGSPIGLAFNRRALDALAARLALIEATDSDPDAELIARAFSDIDGHLGSAEALLGRIMLPEEPAGKPS